jgi:HSP20 family protein
MHSFSPGFQPGLPFEGIQQVPKLDVVETQGEVIYILEVPGVELNTVNVEIGNGTLQIDARVEMGLETEELNYLYRERPFYKRYSRMLSVPLEVDRENAAASVKNGLLMVRFPKKAKGRRLQVNQAQPQQQQSQQQPPNYIPPQQPFNQQGH